MAMGDKWEVLILPATGNGTSYWEVVEAVNPMVAKKVAKARIPSDWNVGNNPRKIY